MAGPREQRRREKPAALSGRDFDYDLDYEALDLRRDPDLYRVGKGEQGVLMVEPYKSEILPFWRFKTPEDAAVSAKKIMALFRAYKRERDFVGMDMARKFLQMGYTRARRYANHRSGRKYSADGVMLPIEEDAVKAESARIFYDAWKKAEADTLYKTLKASWKERLG